MASKADIPSLMRDTLQDGADAYRAAIAAQIAGEDATKAWDAWEQDTAALLLSSWASGAAASLKGAGVPLPGAKVISFAQPDGMLLEFEPGPAREMVARWMDTVPLTRARWDDLIAKAFEAARELREDEEQTAIQKMADVSPQFQALVLPGELPEDVRKRRTPGVQEVARTGFFVTGLSKKKTAELRDLLGKVVRGQEARDKATKRLKQMGLAQFIEQAEELLEVGEDLTAARLENVYRTNLNRASSQGRLDICRDPAAKRFVPLVQYRATKDQRTRASHKAMDGYVATTEMIDAMGIPTPAGFQCRCSWTPVPIATAVSRGWTDKDGEPNIEAIRQHNGARQRLIDSGQFPDPGFIAG
jgi:SPP1 gp7 family putative phage head morphogenesis protein